MREWTLEWREVIDAVGRDFSDGQVHYGADAVEAGAIRRFLEPLEFDCALYYDADYAHDHGYPGIMSPYTATLTWALPAIWVPGDPPVFTDAARDAQPARSPINNQGFPLGPRTTGFFATDIELDFVRPVALGERLGRRGHRLVSCTPKETAVGRGAFMKWESEIVDAGGDVVLRIRTGTYAYQPHQAPSDGSGSSERSGTSAIPPREPGEWRMTATKRAASAAQRHVRDVKVGDELTPVRFPITVYRLVMAAGASRDFNSIHHNTEYAQSTGAREMYANTTFLLGMWERAVRDWIGPAGKIHSITGFRMRSFNYAGDTTTVAGKIVGIGGATIRIEMTSSNSVGITVGPGFVTVSLPE